MSFSAEELERQLVGTANLPQRVDLLNSLAGALRYTDAARAHSFAEEARKLAAGEYPFGLAVSLTQLSVLRADRGRISESATLLLQAHAILEETGDRNWMHQVLSGLGRVYFFEGDYPQALSFFLEALDLIRAAQDSRWEAPILTEVGLAQSFAGNPEKGMNSLARSQTLLEALGEEDWQAINLNSIAECYLQLGDPAKAIETAKKASSLARQRSMAAEEGQAELTSARARLAQGKRQEALADLQVALAKFQEAHYPWGEARALAAMGDTLRALGRAAQSLKAYQKGTSLAENIGSAGILWECHLGQCEAYQALGEYQLALDQHQRFHLVKESLLLSELDQRLKTFEVIRRMEEAKRREQVALKHAAELAHEIEERRKDQAILETLATTDALTGLSNRRHFFQLAEQELQRLQRYGRPLSLIMIDLDHFKDINDYHGHQVGDQAMAEVASRVQASLRSVDLAGRYGGEEFAILLPETTMEAATQVAERLRRTVAGQPIATTQGAVSLTMSLGIAQLDPREPTLDALIRQADRALYKAKADGRNRWATLVGAAAGS
jgi:diguanylate cyclase (GGDEF)-like protein